MEVVLIAAVAANGVIGDDGEMPWHLPEDLAHFKETTMGHPVIMGRVTFESFVEQLGGPLPGRTNIVLSRGDPALPAEVILVSSIEEAFDVAAGRDDRVFVAGGGSVYEETLSRADRLVISELHEAYDGNTHFPEIDPATWRTVDRRPHEEFDIVVYERTEPEPAASG